VSTVIVWAVRGLWALLPLAAGPALADALEPTATGFRTTVSVALWIVWLGVLAASLVPRPATLTLVRIVAPAALATAVWSAVAVDDLGATQLVALVVTAVATGLALHPAVGQAFVDGASYGPERRFPLRAPAPVVVGGVPLAWAVAVAGCTLGPLLLADEQWGVGAVATVVGLPLAAVAVRALHHLADRFLVFVPGGLVVHDPTAVADPVLLRKAEVGVLAPVADGADITGALDLTKGAFGRPLEARLAHPATFSVLAARSWGARALATDTRADHVLVMPTLSQAVLAEAEARGIGRSGQG